MFSCTTAFPWGAQCLPSAPGFLQDPGSQALAGFAGCETLSRHLAGCTLSLFGCSSPGPWVVGGRGAEESGQAAFFTQRKVGLLDFPSAFFLRSPTQEINPPVFPEGLGTHVFVCWGGDCATCTLRGRRRDSVSYSLNTAQCKRDPRMWPVPFHAYPPGSAALSRSAHLEAMGERTGFRVALNSTCWTPAVQEMASQCDVANPVSGFSERLKPSSFVLFLLFLLFG